MGLRESFNDRPKYDPVPFLYFLSLVCVAVALDFFLTLNPDFYASYTPEDRERDEWRMYQDHLAYHFAHGITPVCFDLWRLHIDDSNDFHV